MAKNKKLAAKESETDSKTASKETDNTEQPTNTLSKAELEAGSDTKKKAKKEKDSGGMSRKTKIALIASASGVGGVLLLAGASYGAYQYFLHSYQSLFYPGVRLESFDLSGVNYMDATEDYQGMIDRLYADGITVQFEGVELADETAAAGEDEGMSDEAAGDGTTETGEGSTTFPSVELTQTIVPLSSAANERVLYSIDLKASLDEAYAIGREGDWFLMAKQQFWAWRNGREIQLTYMVDREYMKEILQETFSQYESPAVNADVMITDAGEVEIAEEVPGEAFDYDAIIGEIEQHLQRLEDGTVTIALQHDEPEITTKDIQSEYDRIGGILNRAPVLLTWEDSSWEYGRTAVGKWLSYRKGDLNVSPDLLEAGIGETLDDIEVETQEARWSVQTDDTGAVTGLTEMQPSQDGRSVDIDATAENIEAYLFGGPNIVTVPEGGDDDTDAAAIDGKEAGAEAIQEEGGEEPEEDRPENAVDVVVVIDKPKFTPENVDELGITALLGTGHSNMAGSPYNRRINIGRGVELLNGLLIAPDENFSLVGALKPFTIANGYVAELVIAGNETRPEVGGGLCQIGTTTFRGAMGAGLDITSRANHSYVVSYYSDDRNGLPGTDATIYDPAPDLTFINDTPGYILLQTRIEGTHLYFDFWGTDDGRVANFTPPTISSWVSPPPTKEIPTPDLAPGQRNCTESAHAGTSASFTYTVDYADGTHHEEVFSSYYKPWQAVCLVGEEAPAAPTETTTPATEEPAAETPATDSSAKKSDNNKEG